MIDSEKSKPETAQRREAPRGQILVIFSGTFVILLLMASLVIDLAWLWSNTLRIQRAADAAALAGVVQLPDQQATAYSLARLEAAKNGYTNGLGNVSVNPLQDATNRRRLTVTVTAPVKTFFLGLIGMSTVTVSRDAQAEFVLPVPMGSPENYYGVFGSVRNATMTTTGPVNVPNQRTEDFDGDTTNSWDSPNQNSTGCSATPWDPLTTGNAGSNNGSHANSSPATGSCHYWRDFTFSFTTPVVSINGIEVRLRAFRDGSGGGNSDCRLAAALTWDGGTTWSATRTTGPLDNNEQVHDLGGTADLWTPPNHPWTTTEFNHTTNFMVRLTWTRPSGTTNCGATRYARVDQIEINVVYTYQGTGTTTTTATYALRGPGAPCANGRPNCFQATPAGGGQVLNPRGFWATMNTEGAENVNGDAFQTYYDTRTSQVSLGCPTPTLRACYGPDDYYNYAIEMPAGTSDGYVYIYDPVFCNTALASGTGDRWFSAAGTGMSSFYVLYSDPNNTPYNFADDVPWPPTPGGLPVMDNTFRQIAASDSTMGGSGGGECRQRDTPYNDGRDYHNSWYLLNPANPLPGGDTFRLHTSGTELANPTQQRVANGEQSFAIYATNQQGPLGGAYPAVYGLGAMQMFTPLSASGSATQSEFYLAQIDPIHRGKTLELQLWDPGDTSPLNAAMQVLIPCTPGQPAGAVTCPSSGSSAGWTPATMKFIATEGTANGGRNTNCDNNSSNGTTSITTSTGASLGVYNGCWLTISIVIPDWYTGGGGVSTHDKWWKIRYTMNGTGTSSDVTTWAANIRGNPVHLIEP